MDHAADGSLTGAGHAPEQREQVPPPPPNIYLGYESSLSGSTTAYGNRELIFPFPSQ